MGMWIQVILRLINCQRRGWNECDPCGYIINKKISFLEKEVIPCSNESLPGSVYYFHKTTGWNGTVLEWLDRVPRGLKGFVFTQIHRSAKSAQKRVTRCVWREIPLTRRIWSSLRPLGVTNRIIFPWIYRACYWEYRTVMGWKDVSLIKSRGCVTEQTRLVSGVDPPLFESVRRHRHGQTRAVQFSTVEDGRLSWPVTEGEL